MKNGWTIPDGLTDFIKLNSAYNRGKMITDLSHLIHSQMPVYPGTSGPEIKDQFTVEKNGFAEKSLCMLTHTGTHIDAPAHMIEGGKTLDCYSIENFTGRAFIYSLNSENEGLSAYVKTKISQSDFIIFRTGWHEYWGQEEYLRPFPVPSWEIIDFICSMNIKGVGIDTLSIDAVNSSDFSNHHKLFSRNILIIENLNNLTTLKTEFFSLTALPLLLKNSDGCPARVIAAY